MSNFRTAPIGSVGCSMVRLVGRLILVLILVLIFAGVLVGEIGPFGLRFGV